MTTNTNGINRDYGKWTEAWDSHKLQVAGLSYNWQGFQAWDTLQDTNDNGRTDKVETSLEWKKHFSQFQDMTDVLPHHIHLPVCLWYMNPHSRAAKKKTSHGNQVLLQDTMHPIKRPFTKEDICAKIQQATGPHEDLLTIMNRCRLKQCWHVSHSSSLAKIILQGTVKGGRRQGRQRKRWEDDVREWTGLEFAISQRAVENREKWRTMVVKKSVVPLWTLQLKCRWSVKKLPAQYW